MRFSSAILTVVYLVASVGIPQNLGMPTSGCRCASDLQSSGNCCCAAKGNPQKAGAKSRKKCCTSAAAQEKKEVAGRPGCPQCVAAKECESTPSATLRACSCGSQGSDPGLNTLDEPRLATRACQVEDSSVMPAEWLVSTDSAPTGIYATPDTPPPETA